MNTNSVHLKSFGRRNRFSLLKVVLLRNCNQMNPNSVANMVREDFDHILERIYKEVLEVIHSEPEKIAYEQLRHALEEHIPEPMRVLWAQQENQRSVFAFLVSSAKRRLSLSVEDLRGVLAQLPADHSFIGLKQTLSQPLELFHTSVGSESGSPTGSLIGSIVESEGQSSTSTESTLSVSPEPLGSPFHVVSESSGFPTTPPSPPLDN